MRGYFPWFLYLEEPLYLLTYPVFFIFYLDPVERHGLLFFYEFLTITVEFFCVLGRTSLAVTCLYTVGLKVLNVINYLYIYFILSTL